MRMKAGFAASVALATMLASSAFGQTTSAPAPEVPPESEGIQDIVVTAQRREESLQRVPISVTALPASTLDKRQLSDVISLTKAVPSFSAKPSLTPLEVALAIRGITQLSPNIAQDPAVASYIDGVYNVLNAGSNAGFIDMERVEVLKGPQGTLFGRNTIAGALSITTAKPTDDFGGYVEGAYGNHDAYRGTAVVNLPIIPGTIDSRIVYEHKEHGGYGHNLNNGDPTNTLNQDYVRGTLKFRGRGMTAFLSGYYLNAHGYNFAVEQVNNVNKILGNFAADNNPARNNPQFSKNGLGVNDLASNYLLPKGSQDTWSRLSDSHGFDIKQYGITATIQAELADSVTFKSITGYLNTDYNTISDLDGSPFPNLETLAYPIHANQYTQELQLYGDVLDNRVSYIAGFYYFNIKGSQRNRNITLVTLNAATTDTRAGPAVNNSSYSGFAQLSFLVTPELRLTGGVRYVSDDRAATWRDQRQLLATNAYVSCNMAGKTGVTEALCFNSSNRTFHYVPWTVGIDYQATNAMLFYAKVSKGYRAGAFPLSYGAASTSSIPTIRAIADANTIEAARTGVAPEDALSPEAGAKLDLFDRRLRFNLAAFYTRYNNVQINTNLPTQCDNLTPPNCVQSSVTLNSGTEDIYGTELEVTALLGNLTVGGSLGYSHPKYVKGPSLGTPVINVSKLNTSLTLDLPIRISAGTLDLFGAWAYRSKVTIFPLPTGAPLSVRDVDLTQRGFSLFDARVSFEFADLPLRLSVYGNNIADKKYITAGAGFGPPIGGVFNVPGDPRTYGVSARYTF